MQKLMEKKPAKKVIAILLMIFVFFSGLILSLGSYFSQNNGQVAGLTDVSDPIKLTENYRAAFKQAFQSYLILDADTDWFSDDSLSKTTSIKNKLLSLKVPSDFKDRHLDSVISLTAIEEGIKSKNFDLVLSNIYKLREIIDNL